jgi:hypothetical protein
MAFRILTPPLRFRRAAIGRPLDGAARLGQEAGMADEDDNQPDDATRNRQTIAALVVVALLLVGGWWLMSELQHHREIADCIASGRRDCVPIAPEK